MSDNSAIEWTDASWNPIRARLLHKVGNKAKGSIGWHCEHVTPGCEVCYAERFNQRLGTGLPFKPGHRKDVELFLDDSMLMLPLRWKKPRRIFVCSMSDLFADFVPDEWIDKIFAVMALTPQHTYQVLTKRAARMRDYLAAVAADYDEFSLFRWADAGGRLCQDGDGGFTQIMNAGWPLPNCWLGVSTERQQEADERIPLLLQTPAAVRFISAEPLLGPIDLFELTREPDDYDRKMPGFPTVTKFYRGALTGRDGIRWSDRYAETEGPHWPHLDWVIVGGESGPGSRPMHPDWARGLRDQCAAAAVPFFFKQHGEHVPIRLTDNHRIDRGRFYLNGRGFPFHQVEDYALVRVGKKAAGRKLDGVEHNGFPNA